jgi:protein ImuB
MDLDRALGRLPDPRPSWRAPETFRADHEMTGEQDDRDVLLGLCRELLQSLERFLLTRQLGTLRLTFSFFHLRAPATRLALGCARAEYRADHWFELLRIRFERLTLVEPVIAVRLEGGHNQAMQAESAELALEGHSRPRGLRYSMSQLAERLVARIGHQSVQGVAVVAEHRPHRAWRLRDLLDETRVADEVAAEGGMRRPLWMLPEPARLETDDGYPQYGGPLYFLEGPERLETGWWDEDGIARDYYLAINPKGMQLWIFRNRSRSGDWYLHGFFG